MNKGILIKAGIILGFFAVVLGLAFGCSSIKDKEVTPEISDREDVYLAVGDIEITRQDLWEMMKTSDGLAYLVQMAEEMMLADVIATLSQDEIDEQITLAKYGTTDEDQLAEIMEDAELVEDLETSFEQNLVILGFDPTDADDLRTFAQLAVAKQKITREFILGREEGESLAITDEAMQGYYEQTTKGDVCAIDVRFSSEVEAGLVFDKFNIVPNYNLGWGLYDDSNVPIEDVATGDFDEENTEQMTEAEVFEAMLAMIEYMEDDDTIFDGTETLKTFCASYPEYVLDYEDETDGKVSGDPYLSYLTYLFDTLVVEDDDTEEDEINFSYNFQTVSTFRVVSFKIEQAEVTDYADLTDAELVEIRDEIVENLITDNSITIAMQEYWDENEFEIFEPTLKLQYEFNEGVEFDNDGSKTVVATLGETEITADDLFDYMTDRIGTYYTIEMFKTEYLLNNAFYTDIYGDNYDYINSNNDAMQLHVDELRNMKSIFSSDGYAAYGFSSSAITWEEFIILAFGSNNEASVIRDLFVIGAIQPNLMDNVIEFASGEAYMQEQYDNYFNINVEHLLAYVDFDGDFTPDEYNDVVDALEGADLTEYNALKVDLEDLIKNKVNNDGLTFAEIVTEFNDGLVDDVDNEWAEFKVYGFYLMTENLSTQGSLSNSNTDNYDEDFVDALKRIYDAYVVAVDSSVEDITFYNDDRLVQSDFGLHFIKATEGSAFDLPTAEYDNSDEAYSEGSAGTTVLPNEDQVNLYIQIKLAEAKQEQAEVQLPTSVYDAVEHYFGPIYSAYFTSSGYSIVSAELMLSMNPVYSINNAEQLAFLEEVLEILYDINFPEGFVIPE
jgi:hypothetical protein